MQGFFVKQSHKDIKTAFFLLYLCLLSVVIVGMVVNKIFNVGFIIALTVVLILFVSLVKFFGSYGIYVTNEKIFYKTIRKKEIDIGTIVGIKIIRSKAQVNIAWPSFDIKDKKGDSLYSMIFLSEIEDGMKEYPYGDIEFLRRYRKGIIMFSIYDERLIAFLKGRIASIQIL